MPTAPHISPKENKVSAQNLMKPLRSPITTFDPSHQEVRLEALPQGEEDTPLSRGAQSESAEHRAPYRVGRAWAGSLQRQAGG